MNNNPLNKIAYIYEYSLIELIEQDTYIIKADLCG